MLKTYAMLAALLNRMEKRQALLMFFLMLLVALTEAAGVASVMPFMALLANPQAISTNPFLRFAYEMLSFESTREFMIFVGASVLVLLISSICLKALSQWAQLRFSNMRNHVIACRLVSAYLGQPYQWFLAKNSAGLSSTILNEVNQVVTGSLFPAMQVVAQAMIVIMLVALLVMADPVLAISTALVLGGSFAVIYRYLRELLVRTGEERRQANRKRFRVINEAFGGIKDVKFSGLEAAYLSRFSTASYQMAQRRVTAGLASQLPSFAVQALLFGGMMLVLLYLMTVHQDFQKALPVITLYTFAAYRLMPALQDVYKYFSEIRFSQAALEALHRDFARLAVERRSCLPTTVSGSQVDRMPIKHKIQISNLRFSYPGATEPALKEIDLTIEANSTVAFVGPSGSGKTTIIDILLGLIDPDDGSISVDGTVINQENKRSWQRNLGYVPQSIFLTDDTIAANIAFGVLPKQIDANRVETAARIANLHEFVTYDLPDKYQTLVGERGIRLSGGQRQRIGIARALYHDPDVLVLDEATSALDNITERIVMEAVHNLSRKKTVIIVAHRLSTVRHCDKIFLLKKGRLIDAGTFDELQSRNDLFRRMAAVDEVKLPAGQKNVKQQLGQT